MMNRWSDVIAQILVFPSCPFQDFEHAMALFEDSTLADNLTESEVSDFDYSSGSYSGQTEGSHKEAGSENVANPVGIAIQSCVHNKGTNDTLPYRSR